MFKTNRLKLDRLLSEWEDLLPKYGDLNLDPNSI